MRKDIAKIVNDKGKGPSRRETVKTGKKLDIKNLRTEDQNSISRAPESRRRQYGYDSKRHDSNFKPIDRFLKKNIGKSWDKIFSEICSMPGDERTRQTILHHVERRVVCNTHLQGKQVVKANPWFNSRWGFAEKEPWIPVDDELYVHPKTGCLQMADPLPPNEDRRRYHMAQSISDIWVDENFQYVRENVYDYGKNQTKPVWFKCRWGTVTQGMVDNQLPCDFPSKVGTRYVKTKPRATPAEVAEIRHLVQTEQHWIMKTGKREKSTAGGYSRW
jgi:hypothetical protein